MSTLFEQHISGKINTFDRMIFHGHLTSFFPKGSFAAFLSRQGVLLKDFGTFVEQATAEVKAHAQALAAGAGRPFIYLESAFTAASGQSKEALAREIAERDGVTSGLIAVFSTLEPCWSFEVRGNRATCKKEVVRRRRRCLHFYFYFLDERFGFMHVRLQSWFPLQIQVYINGREWLAREMDRAGIGSERYDNCFTRIDDLEAAVRLAEAFRDARWPELLDAFAQEVNPLLPLLREAGCHSYYWCLDQCEVATDLMFPDRATLAALLPDLFDQAIRAFSAEDVLRFLGRKLHPCFAGEVTTDLKRRPESLRIKHRVRRNSIKMYDKASVLRLETTINHPRDFKIHKTSETPKGTTRAPGMAFRLEVSSNASPIPGP